MALPVAHRFVRFIHTAFLPCQRAVSHAADYAFPVLSYGSWLAHTRVKLQGGIVNELNKLYPERER